MTRYRKSIVLLLAIIIAGPTFAQQKWNFPRYGEEYRTWKDDYTLAVNSPKAQFGYVVNGVFIGTAPLGIAPEKISGKDGRGKWHYKHLAAENKTVADTVIFGHEVHLKGVYEAHTEQPVEWLSLEEVRARRVPKMTNGRKCVYMIDKFFIPGNDSLFHIDSDYIQRVEVLQSTNINVLKDQPPFAFVHIFTRSFNTELAYQENNPSLPIEFPTIKETSSGTEYDSFWCSIPNPKMKYYSYLAVESPEEIYQEEALEEFIRTCNGIEQRVISFLTKKERKRWKKTGTSRPYLMLDISYEGEVLEATVCSSVSLMTILGSIRFKELNEMICSIRFPSFNRKRSHGKWNYRYITMNFSIMQNESHETKIEGEDAYGAAIKSYLGMMDN